MNLVCYCLAPIGFGSLSLCMLLLKYRFLFGTAKNTMLIGWGLKEDEMKYFDYGMFIMGGASLIISWIDNTSAQHLFSGFGVMMIIYSGLNIQERYID